MASPVRTPSPPRRRFGSCSRCRSEGWRRSAAPTCRRSRRSAPSPPRTRRGSSRTRRCRRTSGRAGTSSRRRAGSGNSGSSRLPARSGRPWTGSRITRRRGDVGAAGRADLRAADRFEGRVGPIWKQLHRQYPSVEAEAHAVLDVGGDELLPGGSAGRSTSDSHGTVTTSATRATMRAAPAAIAPGWRASAVAGSARPRAVHADCAARSGPSPRRGRCAGR